MKTNLTQIITAFCLFFNRIFEKVMYKQLKSFIDKYDILSKSISIWL